MGILILKCSILIKKILGEYYYFEYKNESVSKCFTE